MYAVGDAYKAHTECIQAYKKRKREILPSTSSLYCLFLYLPLSAISDNHLLLPASSGIHAPSLSLSVFLD